MACIYKVRITTRVLDGRTPIVEREHLEQALKDLDYPWKAQTRIRPGGPRTDIVVRVGGRSLGLRKTGRGPYEAVTRGPLTRTHRQFLDQLVQRYAYHTTRAKLEAQGFSVTEEIREDNRIHLVLRRMA